VFLDKCCLPLTKKLCSVQFHLHSVYELLSGCHAWSASPLVCTVGHAAFSAAFSAWPTLVASQWPRVNCFLAPTHQRRLRGWTSRKNHFSSLRYDPSGNRTLHSTFGGTCSTNCTVLTGVCLKSENAEDWYCLGGHGDAKIPFCGTSAQYISVLLNCFDYP